MPVWHEQTKDLLASGDLAVVGIIQEQHPDRAKLFMQWQQMDWPIMVDSLNLLDVSVVPIHILMNEDGVVWKYGARFDDLDTFLAREPVEDIGARDMSGQGSPDIGAGQGDAAFILSQIKLDNITPGEALDRAIDEYAAFMNDHPASGRAHFRLGAAYRARYDSDHRQPGDFAKAIEHWKAALDSNPNQYIWRRRIQQYGPRLDKPYSFYDWVNEAREEITARGEEPVELIVEPSGAEFARPAREFESADATASEPDPHGRITRDNGLVTAEAIAVPHTGRDADSVRIHVLFQPNSERKAHWNNEAEPMTVWIDAPDGWTIDQPSHTIPNLEQATSDETRAIELELRRAEGAPESITLPIYALYNVCEGEEGACLYRRLDLNIDVSLE